MKSITILLICTGLWAGEQSPAEQAIASAREAVAKSPKRVESHNALAMALARRARETADTSYYDQAEAALATSLKLEPRNFEARKIQAWLLLGKHRFADALKLATELNREAADDVMVYGLLADAHVELGNYSQAEEAAQWMLNIGRSSVPGLTRAAHLRELFGDIGGALELMLSAFQRLALNENEERAWVLTQMAHLELVNGRKGQASKLAGEALRLFPEYHYALAQLAKIRASEGKPNEAVALLRKRYDTAPHPENLYELAAALKAAGRNKEARESFAEFEKAARAEMESWDNANRELIFYYTDHAGNPEEALRVARLEIARRRDVYTLDAYAWALHKNRKAAEARRQMAAALAVGVRDPNILKHARVIGVELAGIH
ncbi:MAG: tetratricopeptide repeat protein [Bryobacterales bacterium]|nr:tetratricopeptide repeat protein [Bryobacterales bacterium]